MGTELRDNRGLIFGCRVQQEGSALEIALTPALTSTDEASGVWLHFNLNDARARGWISGCSWLPEDAREFLVANDDDVGFQPTGDGHVGALIDLHADDPDSFGIMRLYLSSAYLITGRRHPLAATGLLHRDISRGIPLASSAALFNRLLAHLVGGFDRTVNNDASQVDDAEDRVFAGDYQSTKLAQHRRELAQLRRKVLANRHAIDELAASPPRDWNKPLVKELRQTARALTGVAQDLELVEERARLLGEEINTNLAERTNRNIYFVSMAAVLFLPITLISGIFGMNVAGLPWLDDSRGFLWTILCMAGAVGLTLALMRWRRLL